MQNNETERTKYHPLDLDFSWLFKSKKLYAADVNVVLALV
jgi:hypothetical protein